LLQYGLNDKQALPGLGELRNEKNSGGESNDVTGAFKRAKRPKI